MFNSENQQKSPQKRFLLILGSVMFVFYLALGLALIFWNDIPLTLNKTYRVALGCFLILYAFLRLLRVLQTKRD